MKLIFYWRVYEVRHEAKVIRRRRLIKKLSLKRVVSFMYRLKNKSFD
jgi:hypothetical protein